MFEYKRPEWTYHAKGLWLSTIQQELPFLTMIGSPNFGEIHFLQNMYDCNLLRLFFYCLRTNNFS